MELENRSAEINDEENEAQFSSDENSQEEKKIVNERESLYQQKQQNKDREKRNFLRQLKKKGVKHLTSPEAKMSHLIEVAEQLVNFLLTRKNQKKDKKNKNQKQKKTGGKDSVRKSAKKKTKKDENSELNSLKSDQDNNQVDYLTEQPSVLKGGHLRQHQMVGLNWLISLYDIGFNGILADEMGLGKTIQTIAFFGYLYEFLNIRGPYLIVCPNSVVGNWKKELKKWLPELEVIKLIARKEYRYDIIKDYIQPRKFDIIVTSYEGINICLNDLKKIHWKYIVVDEAHRIKNDQSILSKNLRGLKTELKLLVTGTPLQNNLKELWALLNFLLPELFDDSTLFEEVTLNQEQLTQEEAEQKNLKLITQLHKILRPFLLKRTKIVIDKTIPPKKEIHVYVGLTALQTDIYKRLLLKKAPTEASSKNSMLNILMQLRKACNHPYLFQGAEDPNLPSMGSHLYESSGKMIVLNKLLEKLKFNHQVLIFSQFTSQLDILEDYLNFKEFKYCRIDGSTFLEERENQIREFSEPNSDKFVFLLSTRAGGLGINLTTADTVILYDSDWNPQVDLQAMDRVHRIGQTKNVNVYRLITENTVEEKIVERQRIKLKWDNLVILKGKVSQKKKKMDKNELRDLINYGSQYIFKSENGTLKNDDIEVLLERGEKRAKQMYNQIDSYINNNSEKLFDLGINSINVYEFEGDDYMKKRQQDKQTLQEKIQNEIEKKKIEKRLGKFKNKKSIQPIVKNVELPYYHFYPHQKQLEEILTKDARKIKLTEEEENNKLLWKNQAFSGFTKNDYYAIIRAFEKFDKNDFKSISNYAKKEEEDVKNYINQMFCNLEKLPEQEKILKNIERYQKNQEFQEESLKILNKKCNGIKNYKDITFNQAFYCKIRSKFYTQLYDKFLIYHASQLGPSNYKLIKKILIKEDLFKFEYYLRGVKDSLLGKRIQSLIKMLQNEQEYDQKQLLQKQQEKEEEQQKQIEQEKSVPLIQTENQANKTNNNIIQKNDNEQKDEKNVQTKKKNISIKKKLSEKATNDKKEPQRNKRIQKKKKFVKQVQKQMSITDMMKTQQQSKP